MGKKVIVVMIDGLGDLPLLDLVNKTPLQAAHKPNMDLLASKGWVGLMDPVECGVACGSDTAHLSILGYDPRKYYNGRGAFETMGAGVLMKPGDIAFKCVFACWCKTQDIVYSRKPTRPFSTEAHDICLQLTSKGLRLPSFPDLDVSIKHTRDHRAVVKISGEGLSSVIQGTDPLKDGLPKDCYMSHDPAAQRMSRIIHEVSQEIEDYLEERYSSNGFDFSNKPKQEWPVTTLLLRGCSEAPLMPSIKEHHGIDTVMVAPTEIIAGIGHSLGFTLLEAPGATGTFETCMTSKAKTILEALEPQDSPFSLGFIHIKCADDCGHYGDYQKKVVSIERADDMIGLILGGLAAKPHQLHDYAIVVTGDHSTPCQVKDHSSEPVPFLFSPINGSLPLPNQVFKVESFDEVSAAAGILGRFKGSSVMNIIKKYLAA